MAESIMWMVRAGEGGYLFEAFKDERIVAIGWNEVGDLTDDSSPEHIRERYLKSYDGGKPSRVANAVAMIDKFRNKMDTGHHVITYNPETREYLVGTVTGKYRYDLKGEYHHSRAVDWLGSVGRDSLKPASRNTLGSTLTLFRVNDETADDVLNALQGASNAVAPVTEELEELEQIKEDTIYRAHELIKDKILKLSSDDLPLLVAALLRAMGYKARVSPKGPDRGVDVFASPDGLGLEEPRIKAEVKHRPQTQMGSQELRSFLGGLRSGDRGLYVSTGGFSKDAGYEADRSNIPVTLVTLDELASLIVTHYERFDMEGRVLMPLTRLYWPAE